MELAALAWRLDRLADAVEQLALASRLTVQPSRPLHRLLRRGLSGPEAVDRSVETVACVSEFEVDPADVSYAGIDDILLTAPPALLKLATPTGDMFLALMGSSKRTVQLLGADGRRHRVSAEAVAASLRRHLEKPLDAQVDKLLADARVSTARRSAARRALFATRLGALTATRCWLLRPSPGISLWQHLRHARLPRRLLVFIACYAAVALAGVGSWWLIGAAALEGRFGAGILLAWTFLLLSLVPLGLFARWSQGVLMLGVSGILRMQSLAGALKLDPDENRHQGIGRHFARVIESRSFETVALTGGFYAVAALFELVLAAVVFVMTRDALQLVLLLVSGASTAAIAAIYFRRRESWTTERLSLTHRLVELMVGHRTRLVQELTEGRHHHEDEALKLYVTLSKRMDRAALILSAMPRVWLLVGLAALARHFVAQDTSIGALAAGLGGTLLAFSALGKIITSLTAFADVVVSWRNLRPLLLAARHPEPRALDVAAQSRRRLGPPGGPLVIAVDLSFKFPDRSEKVFKGVSFRIGAGDRIHLSGPSGGGKSTLVSLLTALRAPDSGYLLLDGLDRAAFGVRAWRRRIAAAPQFQENHLFNDTLAFNLLMGRRWPPTEDDLRWAKTVCQRLGLDDLIDRMPNGLFQVVGETGWQLSHGERSRVYMARALLQGADLVVIDESVAEIDPDNLQRCLPEAARLARSLLAVAHT